NIKHINFGLDIDQYVQPLREAAIRRLSRGLDIPPEVVTGFAQVNHWNAFQISESAVKLHIEPLLATICDVLTTGYLWPLLGEEVSQGQTIWLQTTNLTERPDRGPDARELYQLGEMSGDALRLHSGFSRIDAPSEEERNKKILLDVAKVNYEM